MFELTERQINLLKAVVEEYIEAAVPIGSEMLEKKYNFGVSPATIRNEMVKLTSLGLLRQPHTSAGRIPSPLGFKFYIQNLMQQKELPVSMEVAVKEKIWDYRQKWEKALREATRVLADKSHMLAIATTDQKDVYYYGAANLLEIMEFYDMLVTKNLLAALDEVSFWWNIFSRSSGDLPYQVLFGEDLKNEYLANCGVVYSLVETPKMNFAIGVVGPSRLHFSTIIPMVVYFGNLLEEISKTW